MSKYTIQEKNRKMIQSQVLYIETEQDKIQGLKIKISVSFTEILNAKHISDSFYHNH